MNKIIFDYILYPNEVESNKNLYDFSIISIDELKGIANGKLAIFIEPKREYILLKTGIFDYLIQLKLVIDEIRKGNNKPFSVSCDWYSNSLEYLYEKEKNIVKIKEVNSGLFDISINYKLFKSSFEKFYIKVIEDMKMYYPELKKNVEFKRLVNPLSEE